MGSAACCAQPNRALDTMTEKKENMTATSTTQEQKVGIIYCPRPGFRRRWKKIRNRFESIGAHVDYIKGENSADAERIAAMMARNGYQAIIVVGGDAALNYALNGIMKTPAPGGKHPSLGVIPAGYANDFARYWGFMPSDYKRNIASLMANRCRRIDVGVCRTTTESGEHEDYFINCVNIGVAASIMGLRHLTFSLLGLRTLSHLLSAVMLLFKRMSYKLAFTTGGEQFEKRAMTLCIGSAHGYGQTPSAVPYNGLLDVSLVSKAQTTQLLHGLWLLFTGRFLSHRGISVWRTRGISFSRLGEAPISFDGRFAYSHASQLTADVLPEEIDFIIQP